MMHRTTQGQPIGLAALEAQLAQDLDFLEMPSKSWVPAQMHDGAPVRDVIVIGAGMCGLAATAKFILTGISNVVAYDAAPEGKEGPWVTFARMQTLRSPKGLTGPSLGLPQLTFRAWFTAQWGVDAWQALDKIPKDQWMDYLVWYRKVLDLPVRNNVRMTAISFVDDLIAIDIEGAETGRVLTRRLVLATGRSGLGGFAVPEFLKGIDRKYWAHSADEIDFAALKGKRVAVIGAGASSMDNAATALEQGAAAVDLLIRRKEMPRINKMTGIGSQASCMACISCLTPGNGSLSTMRRRPRRRRRARRRCGSPGMRMPASSSIAASFRSARRTTVC